MFNSLLVEKYRPSTIDEFCLKSDNNINEFITKCKASGEIPNLLFVGRPGIGKTTLAKIIVKSLIDCDYLYINASDENGIDTIRSKVTNYAKTKSVFPLKVIILDEADGISQEGQRALRNVLEEYSTITRFILTANYKHKIIPAVQSRCMSFDITHSIEGITDRCKFILDEEGIKYNMQTLDRVVKTCFPDIRKTITSLQQLTKNDNEIGDIDDGTLGKLISDIYKLIVSGHALKCRKLTIKNEFIFGNDYPTLIRYVFNHIDGLNIDDDRKRNQLLVCHKHLYESAFCMDQEINAYACFLALSKI